MARRAARLAVLFLWAALPAVAQTTAVTPREIWISATSALDAGQAESAAQSLDQLLGTGRQLGIRRYPLFAYSATSIARIAEQNGDRVTADWSLAAARKLDDDLPEVRFAAADIYAARRDWARAARHLGAGVANIADDFASRTLATSNLLVVVWLSLAIGAIVFALILFYRHSRTALHDFREAISAKTAFSSAATTVIAVALLFLPLFLWLGPQWLLLYWFALFFAYATLAERIASALLLVVLAALPVALEHRAYVVAGANAPVVRAAADAVQNSYDPEVVQRLAEMTGALPEEPLLHLLLGNLQMQYGSDADAAVSFRRAVELNDRLAGAHLNIGNLHFLNNDFQAAISEYQKAQRLDPEMAIAYYNHAVTSGEQYNFDIQGQQLALARRHDRSLIERLSANRPPQKVVRYNLPIASAWRLQQRLARMPETGEIFGAYPRFAVIEASANSLTVGSLLALLVAPLIWRRRKARGLAGACIKCGRTFCHRCKSARESTTYCTQCIHIYLKRDGVAVDTKRSKQLEVLAHQAKQLKLRKLMTSLLPGSAQVVDGRVFRGLLLLLLFSGFVLLAVFVGRLAPSVTPAGLFGQFLRTASIAGAVVVWVLASVPVYRQKIAG
jgi:tetratricopeptide (TPR) repeat protein